MSGSNLRPARHELCTRKQLPASGALYIYPHVKQLLLARGIDLRHGAGHDGEVASHPHLRRRLLQGSEAEPTSIQTQLSGLITARAVLIGAIVFLRQHLLQSWNVGIQL